MPRRKRKEKGWLNLREANGGRTREGCQSKLRKRLGKYIKGFNIKGIVTEFISKFSPRNKH